MKLKKTGHVFLKIIFIMISLAGLIVLIPNLIIRFSAQKKLFTIEDVSPAPVAIIFGSGLYRDGTPTPVGRERVETGVALYEAGLVEKLLVTGDNRFEYYDEPTAMFNYAVELGVPEEDIVRDFAGRRTYDSCLRAKEIFGVNNAILVTQPFHISRAVYLCDSVGIDVTGVPATGWYHAKRYQAYWNFREIFAHVKAIWDVHFVPPAVVLGEMEYIFPTD